MDSESTTARRVLTSLPMRPLSISDFISLQAPDSLESTSSLNSAEIHNHSETHDIRNLGGVAAIGNDWVDREGIVGFRFTAGHTWFGVGFEPATGWTILTEDSLDEKFAQAIDDRIANWATTFYEEDIVRPSFYDTFAASSVTQLPTRPLRHGELAQILTPGGFYQESFVEVTAVPIIQIEHTDKVIAFLMKVSAPDRSGRVAEYGYRLHTDGTWRKAWADSISSEEGQQLGLRDRPVAVLVEDANAEYINEIDLLVEPPADHVQIDVYISVMSAIPAPGGMWTDAPDWFPSIETGTPVVGLNTDENPGEKTILAYLAGKETGVYVGLNRQDDTWEEVTSFELPVDERLNREIVNTLDGWLQAQYGALVEPSYKPLVQLTTWETTLPDLFASE
ncbi:MAG TPA: hypothetical protein VKA37_08955 [Halobacteriales archaeon]|nr:hypothetical protein [Halobacteriales archaeon]